MAGVNVVQALSLGADAVALSTRAPPTAPTGYYDWEVSSDPEAKRKGHSIVTNVVSAQKSFIDKGGLKPIDLSTGVRLFHIIHRACVYCINLATAGTHRCCPTL